MQDAEGSRFLFEESERLPRLDSRWLEEEEGEGREV